MNKSLATNLISISLIVGGYYSPLYKDQILSVGYFALSGAITNWIAIHMLFEKVPFLYGSGVIPARFNEFKKGIKQLIMGQFFTKENMDRFFASTEMDKPLIDFDGMIDAIDYNKMFQGFVEVVIASPFGGMLGMFGGEQALVPLQAPFTEKMKESVKDITESESFANALKSGVQNSGFSQDVLDKVENIVDMRLNELTPTMVKEIIQEMIRRHLGWLVVWGGIFGGLIGLAMRFVK